MGALESVAFLVRRMRPDQRRRLALSQLALVVAVVLELLIPQQIRRMIDEGIENEDVGTIVATGAVMVGFAIASSAFYAGAAWLGSHIATEAAHETRVALYRKITTLSFGDLDRFRTGPLLVRLTSDISIMRNSVLMAIVMLIRAPVMLVGAIGLVAIETPQLLPPTLLVLALMAALIMFLVPRLNPLFEKQQQRLDDLNTVLQENLSGVQVVKNFVRQRLEITRYTERNDRLYDAALRPARRVSLLDPSFMTFIYVAVAGALLLTGRGPSSTLTAGELATFFNYLLTAMLPVAFLGFLMPELGRLGTSLGRFRAVFLTEPELIEPADATTLGTMRGSVEFDDVTLYYLDHRGRPSDRPVLENISFTVAAGERVVILGSTGSGKTSLINLIPRFYDATSGSVRVDGIDVRSIAFGDLRGQIAVALQQAHIFSGSVDKNIRMGAAADASHSEIAHAAHVADAEPFIERLGDGYEADVAERGDDLSGGQRQRLALARALVSKPRILILDDTTSAVDVATESRIQERLNADFADVTVMMVAQRVSAALSADRILLLDDGRLVGNGTHESLLAESELYRNIVESQLGPLDEVEELLRGGPR